MPKKYYNKVAVGTYATMLLSIFYFIFNYIYSGWGKIGMSSILTPLGIFSLFLLFLAIGLFIWNLRREELTHEQWLEIRDKRRPDLGRLREAIAGYVRCTSYLIKPKNNPALYRLDSYYTRTKPIIWKFLQDTVVHGNFNYLRIRTDDDYLIDVRAEMESLASKLSSDKLRNLIHQLYRRELIARSFQIFLGVYRTQYTISPDVEKYVLQSDTMSDLARYLKKIYDYIDFMERGRDLE